jgi:hypothetical protein
MKFISSLFVFFIVIILGSQLYGRGSVDSSVNDVVFNGSDTLKENHILYYGALWINQYQRVREDQFLFSKDFLNGSLTINGETVNNINLRYDIYSDELLTPKESGVILRLNQEMVDSFTLNFENRTFRFTKIKEDTVNGLKGYFNVLYKGKSSLYVKYRKDIDLLAVDKKWDRFYQYHRIYLEDSNNNIFRITGKRDLFKLFKAEKVQIRNYIKKNKLLISKNDPDSFIPVIRFYDSIKP